MEQSQNVVKESASANEFPNLQYHPGLHDIGRINFEYKWNPQLLARLSSLKPRVLSFDSSVPGYNGLINLEKSPEVIDPNYSIMHFVRGDFTYFRNSILQYAKTDEQYKKIYMAGEDAGSPLEMIGKGVSLPVLTTALLLTAARLKDTSHTVLTRREFIRRGLLAAGLALLPPSTVNFLGTLMKENSIWLSDPKLQQKVFSIAEKLEFMRVSQWYTDGRTAVVTAKTQDAITLLNEPKTVEGAIVMGTAHSSNAQRILHDKEFRNETVRDFGKHVIETCTPLFGELELTDKQIPVAKNLILDDIGLGEIITVKKDSHTQKPIPTATLFYSTQVHDALRPLRPSSH